MNKLKAPSGDGYVGIVRSSSMKSVNPPNHMMLVLMMLDVLEVLWRRTEEMWDGDGEQCERKGGVKF